ARHALREVAVVRDEEQPARVAVQASYGRDPRPDLAQERVHGPATLRISVARDDAARLVQRQVQPRARRQGPAVDPERIARGIDPALRVALRAPADRHPPGAHQGAGGGAGAQARPGERALERLLAGDLAAHAASLAEPRSGDQA